MITPHKLPQSSQVSILYRAISEFDAEHAHRTEVRRLDTTIALKEAPLTGYQKMLYVKHEWCDPWQTGWLELCQVKIGTDWYEIRFHASSVDSDLDSPRLLALMNAIEVRLHELQSVDCYQSSLAFSTTQLGA